MVTFLEYFHFYSTVLQAKLLLDFRFCEVEIILLPFYITFMNEIVIPSGKAKPSVTLAEFIFNLFLKIAAIRSVIRLTADSVRPLVQSK